MGSMCDHATGLSTHWSTHAYLYDGTVRAMMPQAVSVENRGRRSDTTEDQTMRVPIVVLLYLSQSPPSISVDTRGLSFHLEI